MCNQRRHAHQTGAPTRVHVIDVMYTPSGFRSIDSVVSGGDNRTATYASQGRATGVPPSAGFSVSVHCTRHPPPDGNTAVTSAILVITLANACGLLRGSVKYAFKNAAPP